MKDRQVLNHVKDKILESGDTLYTTNLKSLCSTLNDFQVLFGELDKRGVRIKILDLEKKSKLQFPNMTEIEMEKIRNKAFRILFNAFPKYKYSCPKKQKAIENVLQTRNEKNSIVPELAKLLKKYKKKYPNLKVSHLRLLIGEEFYSKRRKAIRPISERTYYRASRFAQTITFL